MDCEANALIVSWSESSGADSYIASLRDSNDQTTTCLGTTTGSCNVTGLGCSQIYQASVVSSDGYCSSPPSVVVETPSGRVCHKDILTEMHLKFIFERLFMYFETKYTLNLNHIKIYTIQCLLCNIFKLLVS